VHCARIQADLFCQLGGGQLLVVRRLGLEDKVLSIVECRFADSNQSINFGHNVAIELTICRALNHHTHLIIILLTVLKQVEACDHANAFVQVTLGMQILTEPGVHVRNAV
jgi:hypothetical protein